MTRVVERADRQRGGQHHGKREQVLRVVDGEREKRRNEKEIKRRDAQHEARIDGPGPNLVAITTTPSRYTMIKLVGGQEIGQRPTDERAGHDHHQRCGKIVVGGRRRRGRLRPRRGRSLLRIAGDDVDVDVAALARQFVDQRTLQPFLPARPARLADDDLRDVAAASVVNQLVGQIMAAERRRLAAQLLDEIQRLRQLLAVLVATVANRRAFRRGPRSKAP